MVNPVLEPVGGETLRRRRGLPLGAGHARDGRNAGWTIRVRYLDRDGGEHDEERRGLTAGTFQHEVDHLERRALPRRADPRSLATSDEWDKHRRAGFEGRARELVERVGS